MNPSDIAVLRDFYYAVRNYLYWDDEFRSEQEYSVLKNVTDWRNRMNELLPNVLEIITSFKP